MSGGLRDYLGLPVSNGSEKSAQEAEFGQAFRERMGGVNRKLQLAAAQVQPADYQSLNAQRMKLYEVYQKASTLIDPRDPSKVEPAIQRVLAAVTALEEKASSVVSGVTTAREEWLRRQADFDDVMTQIGELEESGHPKAPALRQLGEAIRGRANGRHYRESVTAHDGLRPKLDQIYTQHFELTNGAAERNGVVKHNGTQASFGNGASVTFAANDAQQSQELATAPPTPATEVAQPPASASAPTPPELQSASPGEIDRQASCLVTVTNNTSAELTLIDQGHERGDFMTFPSAAVQPGGSTQFVSIETPDSDEQGCRGFALWEVGEQGGCTWRVEWDNVEQGKNISDSTLAGTQAAGFRALDQIGQGDENVPTVFTISETGAVPTTPETPSEAPPANEIDDPVEPMLSETSVTFTVTDKESGEPIAGAAVSMAEVTGETDGDGMVQFQIDPGSYDFRVTSEGHEDTSGSVEAVAGENTEQHIELEKEPDWLPPQESKQPTLRKGDKSVDGWVEYLQSLLNEHLGAGTVETNGVFGDRTSKAVWEFQKKFGCHQDGIVGNETWSVLRQGPKEEIGTDKRAPHTFIETGAEARWMTEDNGFVQYATDTDELVMVAISVGDTGIDDFEATIRVTTNGNADTMAIPIDAPISKSDSGDAQAHRVRIPRFRATYGPGVHQVEAFLPQELGGDLWSGEVDIPAGSTPKPLGAPGSVAYSVTDSQTGEPIPSANVSIFGETIDGESDGVFIDIPSGEHGYKATAKGYEPRTGNVLVVPDEEVELKIQLQRKRSKTPTKPPKKEDVGEIGFKVTDRELGDPVSGATVRLNERTARTDSTGHAVFKDVPAGMYTYYVEEYFYKTASGHVTVLAEKSILEEVQLDEAPGEATHVQFTVVDGQNNEAIPGAFVTLYGEKKRTNSSGVVVFEKSIEDGVYPYFAKAVGYADFDHEMEIESGHYYEREIALSRSSPGRVHKCYPRQSVPQYQEATDGELVPTMSEEIPGEILTVAKEVCVSTKTIVSGEAYKVVTQVKIDRSALETFLKELGISPTGILTRAVIVKALKKIGLRSRALGITVSVALAMLSPRPTAVEKLGDTKSKTGKPVEYTVIYGSAD